MEKGPPELAIDARAASLKLRGLSSAKRQELLEKIADAVEERQEEILEKNALDVQNATGKATHSTGHAQHMKALAGKISDSIMKRLQLKETKLQSAVAGLRQIAHAEEPIGKSLSKIEIMKGLVLEKITVPIGVLLIIFEARPEVLLQITALAIRSGNGLLLKGGTEATESNAFLHQLVCDVIDTVMPEVSSKLVALVHKREEIADLLKLNNIIDLVIPRGSNQLVQYIQSNTKIAVLGHADGICHVYVDEEADLSMACKICVDAKTDYPAACNAVETILVHSSFMNDNKFQTLCDALTSKGVRLYKGNHRRLVPLSLDPAPTLMHEYSSLEVTAEVVDSLNEAIDHINLYGSHHTDTIVTQNPANAETFLKYVDSACVHHNASTRWSDGYRYGLGAEVGISTSRLHARGPVGIEGLMTTKFVLSGEGHIVEGDAHKNEYQFKPSIHTTHGWRQKSLYAICGFAAAFAFNLAFNQSRHSASR